MSNDRESLEPDIEPTPEVPPLGVQTPLHVHSKWLAVLAVLAIIGFLFLARAVFIPITIAVLASYALTPVINWLKRRARLPKAAGAGLTLVLILTGLGFGLNSLQPEVNEVLDIVPRATAKFNAALRRHAFEPPGAVDKMKKAASEIEKAANAAATAGTVPTPTPTAAAKAPAETPASKIRDYLVIGTAGVIAAIGQLVVVVALVYFLLVAGDRFRRTLVRIRGDTLSKKKITVQILDEIDSQIQRYLLVQLATSALLGAVTWIAFAWIGLDNALFWGCVGGVLHLIPYAGPTAFVVVVALVAYVQFDSLQPVAFVIGCALGIVSVIGLLLVPWLTQRVGRLNAVTVFVALLFWGWLWGIWGLLLGVPIVMAINAVCERVEDLQPISEFLGSASQKQKGEASSGTGTTAA